MRGYEDTIQTEFDWIGDIPSEWSVPRLKHLTACLDGKRIPLNGEERSKMQGDIPYWGANAIMDYVSDCLFDEPLLLVGEDGAPFTIKGRDVAFESHGKVWPNNHIHVLRPNDNSLLRFLTYSMNATDYANFVEGSTRQKLTQSALMNIPIALPPKREATQVVKFLDYETAKIDALIDEQKRLIELLKEKRQAVISHAVTKGLNPNAPMKDSGVDWLGEVPEHWDVVPLKHKCSFKGGGTPSKENLEFWNGDIPWVSPKDMRSFEISSSIDKITESGLRNSSTSLVPPGSMLLVARSGILQRTIPVAINSVPVSLNQDLKALTFNRQHHAYFCAYLFMGLEKPLLLELRKQGATVESLEQEYLENCSIAWPPLEELESICRFIENQLNSIRNLTNQSTKLMTTLQERRSALISAAVTGKIDVRDWQPPNGSDRVESQLEKVSAHGEA